MNRLTLLILISFCCGASLIAGAQSQRANPSEVLQQLLARPAPTPVVQETPNELAPNGKRVRPFIEKDNRPPDDAPIEDLLAYWTIWSGRTSAASDKVSQQLLDACVEDPERLADLLESMPKTKPAAAKIKELFDRGQNNQQLDQGWHKKVREWLVVNSDHFLSELVLRAQKVKDTEPGYVENEEALEALAKVNWEAAEPLVRNLAAGGQSRTATLALSLHYRNAIEDQNSGAEERYRGNLKAIASDRNQSAWARDKAVEVLSLTEWPARDEWYLSLFQDETLIHPSESNYGFSPLQYLFIRDPEKWIPIMARLTESKDLAVRSAAASCLITFQNKEARKDALLPLLPWLSNEQWAKSSGDDRLRLIQSMENLDMPESVPGLISVVETDESGYNRSYAAESLAKYRDHRAVPALKKALIKETDEEHLVRIIKGLVACQGFTEQEQIEGIEAYALKLATPEGRAEVSPYQSLGKQKTLPVPVLIGRYLSNTERPPDALLPAMLARIENLKATNPAMASSLLQIVHGWKGRSVDLDMIRRIGNGSADLNTIEQALRRSATWRESFEFELRGLLAAGGPAQGIGAVLLRDNSHAHEILRSDDQLAQIALLASARLVQGRLPLELVGPLLRSKNTVLALAAERYLLIEDSKEARELLWQHHPNEAFITGWLEELDLYEVPVLSMKEAEKRLRDELFKGNGPIEIHALIVQDMHYSHILRVYSDKAVFIYNEGPARYRERVVSRAELATFKEFFALKGIEDRGPTFAWCHHDCLSSEYLSLTKSKGRRVFSRSGFSSDWMLVRRVFEELGNNSKVHYNLAREIKGLEVLVADERTRVHDVWQQGSEIRILVERPETEEEANARRATYEPSGEDELSEAERAQRRAALEKARFSWRLLANGKTDRLTVQPETHTTFDETKFSLLLELGRNAGGNVQMLSADTLIVAKNFDGLWKQVANTSPVSLSTSGSYHRPILSSDKKWVVAAKAESDWSAPNDVVRFNLQTGREFRVSIAAADDLRPIDSVSPHGKVLIRRAKQMYDPDNKSIGPANPEYYLLDPETGETQLVTGEFRPLLQRDRRFLQPTEKPNEFWAAIGDREKNQTQVGRYSLKDFSFKSLLTIPHISFDSMAMWVDAKNEKLYVVYEDQLLSLPFSTSK